MIWITIAVALALGAPHLLRQTALSPPLGVALWGAVLVLRAVVALSGGILIVLYLPTTELWAALTHWCIHAVIPLLTDHLALSGHDVWDAAVLVPAVLMTVSLVGAALGILRGTRAVARWVQARALGSGPRESIVVDDPQILLAAAGMRSPRPVVSTGSLAALDPDELRAGLEHEHGHIDRGHRFAFATGQLLRSLAGWLPGTKAAFAHFSLHLERDADHYAIERTRDPLALASAIGKAALGVDPAPAAMRLAGGATSERMRLLLAGPPAARRPSMLAAALLAGLAALLALALAVTLPAAAQGAASAGAVEPLGHLCPD